MTSRHYAEQMTELVTGEAVRLEIQPASFASRAVSGIIDLCTQAALFVAIVTPLVDLLESLDAAAEAALSLCLFLAAMVGFPILVETLSRGKTLGKLIMGLRTVRDDGGPIRFRYTVVRALVGFVELLLLFGFPALISSLCTERGKRLGDVAAGTFVLRERAGGQAGVLAQMPPHLGAWAQAADIRRLPDGMALSVRQFLSRATQLQTGARAELGQRLTQAVQPYVAPAAPPGTHPEDFLAAVVAERRRRDQWRLAREQQTRDRLAQVDSVPAALARVHRPEAGTPTASPKCPPSPR